MNTRHLLGLGALGAVLVGPALATAETSQERFGAGGYFRIMTRPDFQGGNSRLGYWNLHGRLLNEGPWAALELKLDVLQPTPGRQEPWTTLHAKIEGGSFFNTDSQQGWLGAYGITQLYVQAGNVLLSDVTWQVGTLHSYFGDLGLYDMRPAELFFDTVGLAARYNIERLELYLGVGDAGYFVRGVGINDIARAAARVDAPEYNTVFTGGGYARLRLGGSVELGGGGQAYVEPQVRGNRFAPYQSPAIASYEDFYRGEVAQRWVDAHPGMEDRFPNPTPRGSLSYKLIAYLGFGRLGPLRWNNLFASYRLRHPDNFKTETYQGRDYTLYVKEQTDERYQLLVGDEAQLTLVPERLDAVLGVLFGDDRNTDNTIAAGEDNRTFYSAVLRLQLYLTPTLHLLTESSGAREISKNGLLWREHHNSMFANNGSLADTRGLQFGDADQRFTWQLKTGLVLNPLGLGIFTRPSLRLMYGLQYSNVHNAFANNFAESLDQYNQFRELRDRHWHSVVAIEAEGWF